MGCKPFYAEMPDDPYQNKNEKGDNKITPCVQEIHEPALPTAIIRAQPIIVIMLWLLLDDVFVFLLFDWCILLRFTPHFCHSS